MKGKPYVYLPLITGYTCYSHITPYVRTIQKRTNKIQYVKISKAFHKIYLHHQTLYKTNNVTEFTNAAKLRIKN